MHQRGFFSKRIRNEIDASRKIAKKISYHFNLFIKNRIGSRFFDWVYTIVLIIEYLKCNVVLFCCNERKMECDEIFLVSRI